jgi:hypothetical protein
MITLGVDLASQPKLTAICEIGWDAGRADVKDILVDIDDVELKRRLGDFQYHKIGIDIPLGWPEQFVNAVYSHRSMEGWPNCSLNDLRYRATDEYVNGELKAFVLSVSSDRIAVPAFRAARLMAILSPCVDRTGMGRICEVYPAGALCRWGLSFRKYKRKGNADARCRLVMELLSCTKEWLRVSDKDRLLCEKDDNALDALISCLIARASACGLVDGVPDQFMEQASREGWIALPFADSLQKLPCSHSP